MEISYVERDGEIWFFHKEKESLPTKHHAASGRSYQSRGKVPPEVQSRGEVAVRIYAEQKVQEDMARQKETARNHDAFARNPDFPVEVRHDGKLLKGRIVSAEDSTLTVRLEEPYQGEKFVIYGFGSAMAGHYIFARDTPNTFSTDAIASARRLLIDLYQEEERKRKHQDAVTLVKMLNEGREVFPPFWLGTEKEQEEE